MKGVICGTGACVPERVLDNHKIAEFVDTSDQWIRERTGVLRRHIAEKRNHSVYGGRKQPGRQ